MFFEICTIRRRGGPLAPTVSRCWECGLGCSAASPRRTERQAVQGVEPEARRGGGREPEASGSLAASCAFAGTEGPTLESPPPRKPLALGVQPSGQTGAILCCTSHRAGAGAISAVRPGCGARQDGWRSWEAARRGQRCRACSVRGCSCACPCFRRAERPRRPVATRQGPSGGRTPPWQRCGQAQPAAPRRSHSAQNTLWSMPRRLQTSRAKASAPVGQSPRMAKSAPCRAASMAAASVQSREPVISTHFTRRP